MRQSDAGAVPGVLRRLGSLFYDGLILAALVFAAAGLFMIAVDYPHRPHLKPALQALVLSVVALYLVGFWCVGGQTVGMKTWRMRLQTRTGRPVGFRLALARFVLAAVGLSLGGIAIWWAWLDPQRQFLHDRLLGTRLVRA